MTPMQEVDLIIERACQQSVAILTREVRKVMAKSGRYSLFIAAMGVCAFYDKKGMPMFADDCSREARDVLKLANEITDAFGSPGIEIAKE